MQRRWSISMLLVDANVILRYLLCDNEEMARQARDVIAGGAYTTVEVLAEVVYVLSGVYHAERAEIQQWLTCFLDEIVLDNKQAILYALRVFAETRLDFVDCVLIGYNRILGEQIYTFDKKLNRMLSIE